MLQFYLGETTGEYIAHSLDPNSDSNWEKEITISEITFKIKHDIAQNPSFNKGSK